MTTKQCTIDSREAMAKLTGLQRDVLALYRQCLRALREKPAVRISQLIRSTSMDKDVDSCIRIHERTFVNTQGEFRSWLDLNAG
jgi:hypothetical protein